MMPSGHIPVNNAFLVAWFDYYNEEAFGNRLSPIEVLFVKDLRSTRTGLPVLGNCSPTRISISTTSQFSGRITRTTLLHEMTHHYQRKFMWLGECLHIYKDCHSEGFRNHIKRLVARGFYDDLL